MDQIDTTIQVVISNMVPKLPVPYDYSVVSQVKGAQKEIQLHFMCGVNPSQTMTTTSTEWNKWLRLGASAVQAGRSVVKLASGDVTELQKVAGWKEAFSSMKGGAQDGLEVVKSLQGCHEALTDARRARVGPLREDGALHVRGGGLSDRRAPGRQVRV